MPAPSTFEPQQAVVVRWTGDAREAHEGIWIARVDVATGAVLELTSAYLRHAATSRLLDILEDTQATVVGFNFPFSLPAWFLRDNELTAKALWADAALRASWLETCPEPFYGRAARRRPWPKPRGPLYRETELAALAARGIATPTVFRLAGSKQPGATCLRCAGALDRLQAAGVAIWPFDDPRLPMCVEIDHRLLLPDIDVFDRKARAHHIDVTRWPQPGPDRDAAVDNPHAFEAVFCARRLAGAGEIVARDWSPTVVERTEGRIYEPSAPPPAPFSPVNHGQLAEWLTWISITAYADPLVHMFLPLGDRGVDGIARRPWDDAVCAVQVKGRTYAETNAVQLNLPGHSLVDEGVTMVIVALEPSAPVLHPTSVVCSVGQFKHLSRHNSAKDVYEARISWPPGPRSRWQAFAVATTHLSQHIMPRPAIPPPLAMPTAAAPPPPSEKSFVGELAEIQVCRLLLQSPQLNVFKSFPDLETTEYLVRHRRSGKIRGIQVKAIGLREASDVRPIHIGLGDYPPSPITDVVVLGWRLDIDEFIEDALLIPVTEAAGLGNGTERVRMLRWQPSRRTPIDRYRIRASDLPENIESRFPCH
jgi:hypothetical protein